MSRQALLHTNSPLATIVWNNSACTLSSFLPVPSANRSSAVGVGEMSLGPRCIWQSSSNCSHVVGHIDDDLALLRVVKGHAQVVVYFSSHALHRGMLPILLVEPDFKLVVDLGVKVAGLEMVHVEPVGVLQVGKRTVGNTRVIWVEFKTYFLQVTPEMLVPE
jgi:hypothetical protein